MNNEYTNYLMNRKPSVITGVDGQQIIIPPLNTDIRFSSSASQTDRSLNDASAYDLKPYSINDERIRDSHKLAYTQYYGK